MTARARSPLGPRAAARLAQAVLRAERAPLGVLSIAFVGRAAIRSINRRYLRRDRVTDVIAFALGAEAGDVYICPAVAAVQARRFQVPVRLEVARLVVHGVLHVLGHDHPEGTGREGSAMWRRQERLLARWKGRPR